MAETINKVTGKPEKFKNTYWLDGWEGECHSGFYVRSNLFQKIAEFKKLGHKVVAIRIQPGDWNMEFICETPGDKKNGE